MPDIFGGNFGNHGVNGRYAAGGYRNANLDFGNLAFLSLEEKIMILYDENICVRCLACVSESEFGGVTYERGRIFFDQSAAEDWENIISICPVAAIGIREVEFSKDKTSEVSTIESNCAALKFESSSVNQ